MFIQMPRREALPVATFDGFGRCFGVVVFIKQGALVHSQHLENPKKKPRKPRNTLRPPEKTKKKTYEDPKRIRGFPMSSSLLPLSPVQDTAIPAILIVHMANVAGVVLGGWKRKALGKATPRNLQKPTFQDFIRRSF